MRNKPAHKNHTRGSGKTKKSFSKFLVIATSNHLNVTPVNGQANLTQLLSINKKLHKAFNKLIQLDKRKLAFEKKKVKMKLGGENVTNLLEKSEISNVTKFV